MSAEVWDVQKAIQERSQSRLTVTEYLKGCHQQNALERLPDWQLDVDWELYRLKGQVRLLMVMVLLLAVVLLLCLLVGVGVCYVR